MANVIRRIHKLRKYREQEARMDLLEAEAQCRNSEDRLAGTNDKIARSRANCSDDVSELARHHAYALRMEMVRRRDEAQLLQNKRQVSQSRGRVQHAAREAKIVETLADNRDADRAAEVAQRTQRGLDDAALQAWWRKATA